MLFRSKQYRIGAREGPYDTLREALMRAIRTPFQRGQNNSGSDTIWALRDIAFRVMPGDVIGIIGRSGVGKSTLLKILSRITEPTTGRVELYGRVGSLLEVGTGFHLELSGRENIYLNGAILGMKRAEITRKFDEIVAFAEVERFIDTPVKRYSTGMYLRLAFAVAAFLETEILLVDEVLAVGDASFQKKCLGKMRDVSANGRTVLFVSHNMAAIEALCSRCLLISQGRLRAEGEPTAIMARYLESELASHCASRDLSSHSGRRRGCAALMAQVTLYSNGGLPSSCVRMGEDLSVQVGFQAGSEPFSPVLGLVVKNLYGMPIFAVNNRFIPGFEFSKSVKRGTITCHLERPPLLPGTYFLDLYLGDRNQDLDIVHEAISFDVLAADVFGTGQLPPPAAGPIYWPARWTLAPGGSVESASRNEVQ